MPVVPAQSCQRGDARMSKTHTNEGIRFRFDRVPGVQAQPMLGEPTSPDILPRMFEANLPATRDTAAGPHSDR